MGGAIVRRSGDRLILQPDPLLAPETRADCGDTRGVSGGALKWVWGVVGCRIRGTMAVPPGPILGKNVLSQYGDRRVTVVRAYLSLTYRIMGRKGSQSWMEGGSGRMLVPFCCLVLRMTGSSLSTV